MEWVHAAPPGLPSWQVICNHTDILRRERLHPVHWRTDTDRRQVVGRNVVPSVPMDTTPESTMRGIHYTGSGGICQNGETHTSGTLTGNTTARCYDNIAHTNQSACTFS